MLSTKQNITFVVLLQTKRPFCIPTFMKIYYFKTYFDTFNKNKKWRLLMNQNKLKLISPIAKESVSTLIQMNSMVGTYINNTRGAS